jgi:hypothetical protein
LESAAENKTELIVGGFNHPAYFKGGYCKNSGNYSEPILTESVIIYLSVVEEECFIQQGKRRGSSELMVAH